MYCVRMHTRASATNHIKQVDIRMVLVDDSGPPSVHMCTQCKQQHGRKHVNWFRGGRQEGRRGGREEGRTGGTELTGKLNVNWPVNWIVSPAQKLVAKK